MKSTPASLNVSQVKVGMLVYRHYCGGTQLGYVTKVFKTRCAVVSLQDWRPGRARRETLMFDRAAYGPEWLGTTTQGLTGLRETTPEEIASSEYWRFSVMSRVADPTEVMSAIKAVRDSLGDNA